MVTIISGLTDALGKELMDSTQSHSILFELLRSFTTLARTLNLSHAVRELGSTRQTVRRHIMQLEEMRNEQLFDLTDRQYVLTEAGRRALPEAQDLLARGAAWAARQASHVDGLFSIDFHEAGTFDYHLQQRPISDVWTTGTELMRCAVTSWALAGGEIEAPAMAPIRPYLLVYRRLNSRWLCCEIGEESAFSTWFGWAKARSSVGAMVESMPGGGTLAALMDEPFSYVSRTHGLRLDHVFTRMPREEGGPRIPMSFQRLNMGARFPDGSFALVSVVERTHKVDIPHLDEQTVLSMPEDLVMNVAIPPRRLQSFVA